MASLVALLWLLPSIYVSYRLTRTLVALLWAILIYKLLPLFYEPDLKKWNSRWTVVTGATDGIGRAYTKELARRGVRNFLLIGRNQSKLNDIKAFLELTDDCRVKTKLFDFLDGDYAELRSFLHTIDIGLVVNSVGMGRENLERYGDNPSADRKILAVNGLGSAEFLSSVLPSMERNGGGQIVVLSSSQGYRPIPLLAAYCATKAMMSFLSEAIDREYSNIRVQCLTPALVATNMVYIKEGSLFVVTPEDFAREAVGTLGLVTTTTGCFNHEVQMLIRHLFPWRLLKHLVMPIYYHHKRRMIRYHSRNGAASG